MSYLIPLESYKDFDKIIELKRICDRDLADIDWNEIKAYLLAQPKDETPSETIRWMEHIANVSIGEVGYQDNNRELELCVPEIPDEVGSWFYISLKDGYQTRQDHSPKIRDAFKNLSEFVTTLPKAIHASINIFSSKMVAPDHQDGFPDHNSILITFKISKTKPTDVGISIEGEHHSFKDRDFLVFDPEMMHSGTNTSDSDWCFMIVRIDKEEFNENIKS